MPEHSPDAVYRAIVTRLQRDGRIANVDLADAIALSPSVTRVGKAKFQYLKPAIGLPLESWPFALDAAI